VRVRPTWLRWSDFAKTPQEIVEVDAAALGYEAAAPAPLTDDQAIAFARAHVDVWNSHDLDAILTHYSDDAVLTSPVAHALTGAATLCGKSALRDYFALGLTRYPDLQFELHQTFRGQHGVTLLFQGVGGRMVAEVLRLDRHRKITRVDAHYACSEGGRSKP
jgi:ketosteroid isomerase-like protein